VLTRNREIAHTWADLKVADWDVEEVLQYPFKMTGVLIYIHYIVFQIIYWILTYVLSTKTISFYQLLMRAFYH
jgi:hypothetical protein